MKQLRVQMTGVVPLIMHNNRLANPLDPLKKRMSTLTGKRKKTDDDQVAIMEIEFAAGLYIDDEIGPYIPAANFKAMLVEAAKKTKQGKDVKEALSVLELKTPLLYKGPRDLKKLWADDTFRDVRSVKQKGTGGTIMRCRPIFHDWKTEWFTVVYDETIINQETIVEWLKVASVRTGFMDNRPDYGKFTFEVEE